MINENPHDVMIAFLERSGIRTKRGAGQGSSSENHVTVTLGGPPEMAAMVIVQGEVAKDAAISHLPATALLLESGSTDYRGYRVPDIGYGFVLKREVGTDIAEFAAGPTLDLPKTLLSEQERYNEIDAQGTYSISETSFEFLIRSLSKIMMVELLSPAYKQAPLETISYVTEMMRTAQLSLDDAMEFNESLNSACWMSIGTPEITAQAYQANASIKTPRPGLFPSEPILSAIRASMQAMARGIDPIEPFATIDLAKRAHR